MVRIPAGIHKKTKHTNLETAANAACVNECTCYWAFTKEQKNILNQCQQKNMQNQCQQKDILNQCQQKS